MNVIRDVKARQGNKLPPLLRIQGDNYGRKNKNQYFFALCTTLVGLGYFVEVHLSFLIVEHIHKDINQRFNIIFGIFKCQDIDLLQQLLYLVCKGTSYIEEFVTSHHLQYIWD